MTFPKRFKDLTALHPHAGFQFQHAIQWSIHQGGTSRRCSHDNQPAERQDRHPPEVRQSVLDASWCTCDYSAAASADPKGHPFWGLDRSEWASPF